MRRNFLHIFYSVLAGILLMSPLQAALEEPITAHVPHAQLVGKGTMSVALWDIYDAALYAPNGTWQQDQPFALKLTYKTDFKGEDIAERSLNEMKRQNLPHGAPLETWLHAMTQAFPDVDEGSALIGIKDAQAFTRFYSVDAKDGRLNETGIVKDPQFAPYFFGIWLSEHTSEPALRNALLK